MRRVLTPVLLWGLGVGYVISGMYFGWNLGLEKGGTYGMAIATGVIILLYTCFSFSYAELACYIPQAGGVFDYTRRAMGDHWAFVSGMAQWVEFVFAPPAIAFGIGAYFNLFFPSIPILPLAIGVYIGFTALNIYGIKTAASFELIITIIAVIELLIFAGVTLPHFSMQAFIRNPLPHGWTGVFAALPFAIWFFLGIEGLANVAEEAKNPQQDITRAFTGSLWTLVSLCIIVFISAIGVGGWQQIVFKNGSSGETSDSPLPLAMAQVVGTESWLFHLLLTIGLFGLVASFHGLLLAAGRSTFEFGKAGFFPPSLGQIHPRHLTPARALISNMIVGILALCTNKTGQIITISVFGALTLYVFALISLFILRSKEPRGIRPFTVPFYPWMPGIAIVLAGVSFVLVAWYNKVLFTIYLLMLTGSYWLFYLIKPKIKPL
jgi:ethanolamine permease